MSENHPLDFVCVSCWEGFQVEPEKITGDQESVVCPHCGADVPIPQEAEADGGEELAAGDESEASVEGAGEEQTKKKRKAPQAVLVEEDPEVEEEEEEEPEEEVEPSTEPEEILWRVQVPGGLAYNFHGISTLKRWCGTKRTLNGIAVGYQHEAWRKLDQFMDKLLDGDEPLGAYAACDTVTDPGLPTPGQESSAGLSSAHNAFASIPSLAEIEAQIGSSYTEDEEVIADSDPAEEASDLSNEDSFGDLSYTSPAHDQSFEIKEDEEDEEDDIDYDVARRDQQDDSDDSDDSDDADELEKTEEVQATAPTAPVIPDLAAGDVNASGQFTFQVSTGRSDIGARVLMLFLGVLMGLGLGAVCQYLGYWDKLIPPK